MKESSTLRILLSGGGTGGHVYPAVAIAEALRELNPGAELLFVGAEGRMEMEKVPQAGFPIEGLPVMGLQRRLTLKNLQFPLRLLQSLWKAWQILKNFNPHVVIGTGGYASGPVLRLAQWMGVPTIIQEQNGYAGLTNRLLAARATRICVALPGMEKFFPAERIVLTGNPVRASIATRLTRTTQAGRAAALASFGLSEERPTVLILGGSGGALAINQAVAEAIPGWIEQGFQIIWQTGKVYYERFAEYAVKERVIVTPFINQMENAYAAADLVVSRAGAMAITELCLAGKAAILIPSPNVTADHQTKNAEALVAQQAAVLLPDSEAKRQLAQAVSKLLQNQEQTDRLAQNIRQMAKPQAAHQIAALALQLAGQAGVYPQPKNMSV